MDNEINAGINDYDNYLYEDGDIRITDVKEEYGMKKVYYSKREKDGTIKSYTKDLNNDSSIKRIIAFGFFELLLIISIIFTVNSGKTGSVIMIVLLIVLLSIGLIKAIKDRSEVKRLKRIIEQLHGLSSDFLKDFSSFTLKLFIFMLIIPFLLVFLIIASGRINIYDKFSNDDIMNLVKGYAIVLLSVWVLNFILHMILSIRIYKEYSEKHKDDEEEIEDEEEETLEDK